MAKTDPSRSFGLSTADTRALQERYAKMKKFPNPYRTGVYGFTVDALVSLGVNKRHPISKVHEAFKRVAGNEWYADWAAKERRNEETGKDADGRFLQNLKVLQRTKDYGLKLLQVGTKILKTKGCVIDIVRDNKRGLLIRLNTRSAKPIKAGRSEPVKPVAATAGKTFKRSRTKRRTARRGSAPVAAENADSNTALPASGSSPQN